MKRSSKAGRLAVIFIAAAAMMAVGAVAAGEDGAGAKDPHWIDAARFIDKGDAVLVPNVKVNDNVPNGMGVFPGGEEPAVEEDDPPPQGGEGDVPNSMGVFPEGAAADEEADQPHHEAAPPPPPMVIAGDGGDIGEVCDADCGHVVDCENVADSPVEVQADVAEAVEELLLHWTGSGGCATLMPGAPASAGSALTFLLWLAPLAAIRRGKIRTLIAVFALAVPAMLIAGCSDSSELAGFSSGPPPEEEPLSPVAPESEGEAAEAPDGSEAAAEPSEAADDGAKQGQEVEVEITAVVQGAPTASGGRLVEIAWSLKNVSGAYISLMPSSSFVKLVPSSFFSHAAFIGSSGKPHLGTKSIKGKSWQMIAKDLLDDPLAEFDQLDASVVEKIGKDTEGHPFSYCMESTIFSTKSCYKIMSTSGPNVFRVFFPLRKGETSRAGTWIFEISGGQEALPVLYRDALKGKIHWMKVEIQ